MILHHRLQLGVLDAMKVSSIKGTDDSYLVKYANIGENDSRVRQQLLEDGWKTDLPCILGLNETGCLEEKSALIVVVALNCNADYMAIRLEKAILDPIGLTLKVVANLRPGFLFLLLAEIAFASFSRSFNSAGVTPALSNAILW